MKSQIKDVSPGHWRIQAAEIVSNNSKTLLINSYFPCDQVANEDEVLETLAVIRNTILTSRSQSVIWTGDINTDFKRDNRHSKCVRDALDELDMKIAWDDFDIDFTCVQEREGSSYISTIDHFFLSRDIFEKVTEAGVIHHPENPSDHSPIYCILESITTDSLGHKPAEVSSKPSWKKATDEQKEYYEFLLEEKLNSVMVPTEVSECKNLHCKDDIHLEAIDWYVAEVLEAVQEASEKSLPIPKPASVRKTTPGFHELVKPYKDTAYFWSSVWKSAGKPINTALHNIMKHTRNVYHREVKKCVKAENTIKKNKLLDSCINGKGDLFTEIRNMRKTRVTVPDNIDGVTENITDHFKSIYVKLYNCVNDANEVALIYTQVDNKITNNDIIDIEKVTTNEVKKAAGRINPGKSDPTYRFSSDCIKVRSVRLAEHTANIIQTFLVHIHISMFLLVSTLVPIIKDKLASINTSKNYRSVCISSLILKQIDWVIIHLYGDAFSFHELQFAYQPGVSANICTWAVVETIEYFVRNGSDVFVCSMDKSKAFDLTKFSVLFNKILESDQLNCVFLILIFIKFESYEDVALVNSKARNLPNSNQRESPRLVMYIDARARTRYRAFQSIARTIRLESDGEIQTSIRSGRRDFLLRKRERQDKTPWSAIPPLKVTSKIPPIEIGMYKSKFYQDNDKENHVNDEGDMNKDQMDEMEKDLTVHPTGSETNKRNLSTEKQDTDQSKRKVPRKASPRMEKQLTSKSSSSSSGSGSSSSSDSEEETKSGKQMLNSTPIPDSMHSNIPNATRWNIPETPEGNQLQRTMSGNQNFIPSSKQNFITPRNSKFEFPSTKNKSWEALPIINEHNNQSQSNTSTQV